MSSQQCGGGCWVCQAAEDARAKRYPRTPVGKELAAQAKGGGGRGSAAVAGLESYTRKTLPDKHLESLSYGLESLAGMFRSVSKALESQ